MVRESNTSVENVLLGWMGFEIPAPIKHRNKSRAAYRKTSVKRQRGHSLIGSDPKPARRQSVLF